jgi:hypothetical protein
MRAPKFSLDDFKKWMESQKDDHTEQPQPKRASDLIGVQVESKVSERKLIARMVPEDGEAEDLALDFLTEGGVIADVNGKDFLIEVESGTFYITRHCVRRVS